uniref:Toll/interleukin-1 receptor domain-containing protein n=1 Tax=Gracilinema caldarium TaxID=215591 RepID=A0A7C3I7M8_9SPIR
MRAFISYSSKQIELAQEIKNFLKTIDIDSFVANDDLRTASDWKKMIVKELSASDIFIPILTLDFKQSEWCSQELGIAFIRKKKIIPISLDGCKPYGFINNLQARSIKEYGVDLIISEGLLEYKIDNGGLGFAELLKKSGLFRYSEKIFKILQPYYSILGKESLNKIIEYSISNSQVWAATECANNYIPVLLKERKKDIDPLLYKKIQYQIEQQEWYKEG